MTRTTRDRIRRYLEAFDFAGLFTDPDLGWDWPQSKGKLRVPTKNGFIDTEIIAEKRGVKVLHLAGLADGEIPPSDERKAIEKAVTPLAAEHLLIFTDNAKTRQVWLWTSRHPGKPIAYRELTWEKGKPNELLLQKLRQSPSPSLKKNRSTLPASSCVCATRSTATKSPGNSTTSSKRRKTRFGSSSKASPMAGSGIGTPPSC
jgi:hypothetical protein